MAQAVELATAYLALVPSLEGASGAIGKELGGPAVQGAVGKAGDKAGKTFAGKFSSAGKLAAKGLGLGLLGAAAASGAWAAQTVKDLANVQRIGALTESTIKATGGAAGRSRADIDRYAGSIEKMSGIEAETVTEGQNMLLTFRNIKGQRFDEATSAMTDMAVAMNKGSLEGLDMKSASIQLGKALNDPIKGVSALAKVGVSFSDQQKEQIKTMVEAGDVAGAQGVILDEMKAQFGGAAEAAGGTFQGNVAKLQNTFGNFSEGLLAGALPAVTGFVQFLTNEGVPALERTGAWIKANVVPAVKEMSGAFRDDVLPVLQGRVVPALGTLVRFLTDNWRIIGSLAAAVLIYVAAMKAYAGIMTVVTAAQKVHTAAVNSDALAKARSAAQTAALAAMYTGSWLAAQARSVAGWVRETAAIVANRVAMVAATAARNVSALASFVATNARSTAVWIAQTASIVANRAALVAVGAAHGIARGALLVATAAQWAYNAALSANPIGLVIVAIGALVAGLVWFFTKTELGRKIVAAAWAGIKTAMSAVATWWTKTAWPAIRAAITAMGQWFTSMKDTVVAAWGRIRDGAAAAWQWVRDWVITPFKLGVYLLGVAVGNAKDRVVASWQLMRDRLAALGSWIRSNVFDPIKRAVGLVGDAFKATPRVVEKAWNSIRSAAAKPINFVINTVYMKGIKGTWDKIADAVGLDLKLPTIKPIAFAQGSEDHRAQIARGGAMRLWAEPETGGEAYIPLASSKRGRSTAILSAVASKFGYGLQKYADGGIAGWFGDAWDKIKNVSSSFLSGPAALIKRLITGPMSSALGSVGGGSLGKLVSALPKKLVSGLVEKAKDFASSMFGGGAGGGRFAGKGMGWQAMWNIVRNQFPGASLNSAYRPGAITAVGTPSFHGKGRAIDVSPSMAIFNWLAKTFPNSSELIFSPAGRRQLYMGRQTMFGGVTRANHWDHVHWAMANGGMFSGVYDQGGWMPPGGIGVNRGTRPEAVLDPDESRALKAGLGTGPLIGTLIAADMDEAVYKMQRYQRRAATRAGLAGVR